MTAPATLYLVVGATGEGGDQGTWNVAAYHDRPLAEQHVARLHSAAGGEWRRLDINAARELSRALAESGLDPNAAIDYTGVSYAVEEVTLRTQVPGAIGPRGRLSPLAADS